MFGYNQLFIELFSNKWTIDSQMISLITGKAMLINVIVLMINHNLISYFTKFFLFNNKLKKFFINLIKNLFYIISLKF